MDLKTPWYRQEMAWFALARVLFVGALAYSAAMLHPLPFGMAANVAFALGLAGLVAFCEAQLRETADDAGARRAARLRHRPAGRAGDRPPACSGPTSADGRVAFLDSFILIGLAYLGLTVGAQARRMARAGASRRAVPRRRPERRYKILDTSVIIDGRIADVCETGFIDGTLVIPQFVLKELQLVADSSDSLKRNRGRRGLDILQKIKKMSGIDVTISDADFPGVHEVDLKLIELARTLRGKIVTNDFNLNKVAQLRGVDVLNVNDLANSLKPVVLPGEIMKVFILKEGKEYNQGVAYLDDGTMVVVDNARKMISKTIDIVVTSVLQTTAGKMIFGRHIDPGMAAPLRRRPRRNAREENGRHARTSPAPQPQT